MEEMINSDLCHKRLIKIFNNINNIINNEQKDIINKLIDDEYKKYNKKRWLRLYIYKIDIEKMQTIYESILSDLNRIIKLFEKYGDSIYLKNAKCNLEIMKTGDYFNKREFFEKLIDFNFYIENENKYDNINGPSKLYQFIETKKICENIDE